MNEHDQERIGQLLRKSLPATQVGAELRRDLWPAMLKRLEERSTAVLWFDWALAAALVVWLVFSPGAIPVLLYHL